MTWKDFLTPPYLPFMEHVIYERSLETQEKLQNLKDFLLHAWHSSFCAIWFLNNSLENVKKEKFSLKATSEAWNWIKILETIDSRQNSSKKKKKKTENCFKASPKNQQSKTSPLTKQSKCKYHENIHLVSRLPSKCNGSNKSETFFLLKPN